MVKAMKIPEAAQRHPFNPQPFLETDKIPAFAASSEYRSWQPVLQTGAPFGRDIWLENMTNLIRNPNLTSTHVFRAEVWWDSAAEYGEDGRAKEGIEPEHRRNQAPPLDGKSLKHIRAECKPWTVEVLSGWRWRRTWVRNMIPRNPALDKPLAQSCHLLLREKRGEHDDDEETVMLYVPHAKTPDEVPFYHPAVATVAFTHHWNAATEAGQIGIWYRFFDESSASAPIPPKLTRTAHHLLHTIHKHGKGMLANYVKRVHHDLVIPQSRFQDKYTELKMKYARTLIQNWVEDTPPDKHVFEDLGIAAFCICLWEKMFACDGLEPNSTGNVSRETQAKFPGFVDVACGNGVLVNILVQEGWKGYGFDARARKSWTTFPDKVQSCLREELLIPRLYQASTSQSQANGSAKPTSSGVNDGIFARGIFIVSNHADELTPWTPLLAYLNHSSFIAIPCCSHDLSGARTRFTVKKTTWEAQQAVEIAQIKKAAQANGIQKRYAETLEDTGNREEPLARSDLSTPAADQPFSGDLLSLRTSKSPHRESAEPWKQPSSYASLTAYITSLSQELGFRVEKEMLRIPSTRNAAVIGYTSHGSSEKGETTDSGREADLNARMQVVQGIVQRGLKDDIESVGRRWIERAERIQTTKGNCH